MNEWTRSRSLNGPPKWPMIAQLWKDVRDAHLISDPLISLYLDACGIHRQHDALVQAWADLRSINYPLNSNHYNSMIEALHRLGHTKEALEVYTKEMCKSDVVKPSLKTLVTLVGPLVRKPFLLRRTLDLIKNQYPALFGDLIQKLRNDPRNSGIDF